MEGVIQLLEESMRRNWDRDALTDYKGETLRYCDVARRIAKLHLFFEAMGMQRGDRIAICGRNSSNWGVVALASLTYGTVTVPILHEFKADTIHNIINHSEARLVFVGDVIWEGIVPEAIPNVRSVLQLNDMRVLFSRDEQTVYAIDHLNELFGNRYPHRFDRSCICYEAPDEEVMALINYTSGSTGFAKGVMIPYRALTSNLEFVYGKILLNPGDRVVSMLPMAHMYGFTFEFLWEMTLGAHVFLLTRLPSPKVIFEAFSVVKPNVIVAVPLIIEKIIRKAILPRMETFPMKVLVNIPIVNEAVRNSVREQMIRSFGGEFYEIVIGGAAFNQDIDRFLHSIRFPHTVGYGATECAPIICYEDWKTTRPGSCGKPVVNMEVRIDSDDPQNVAGEVLCRGANVMLGYYKNEELTRQTIDADGWLHTGDLGVMDDEGRLYIRGRSKNMILGPSGQNIYPEEIEDRLNAMPCVSESLVIDRGGKIIALVYADAEQIMRDQLTPQQVKELMEQNRAYLNRMLPIYSQVSAFEMQAEEFEKTPKKSIKRYLYH